MFANVWCQIKQISVIFSPLLSRIRVSKVSNILPVILNVFTNNTLNVTSVNIMDVTGKYQMGNRKCCRSNFARYHEKTWQMFPPKGGCERRF